MDVSKAPPLGILPASASLASQPNAAAATDRADIRPLDVTAALQILIAEVRASFELTALGMDVNPNWNTLVEAPPQAARAVLQLFLQSIPEDTTGAPAWTAAVTQAEALLQAGLERGSAVIGAWREVPAIAVEAAKETQALIFSALTDDAQSPVWLRPEWAGLAPRLERYWRRRRLARRPWTDPDYPEGNLNDDPR